jgi:hypothetical protein
MSLGDHTDFMFGIELSNYRVTLCKKLKILKYGSHFYLTFIFFLEFCIFYSKCLKLTLFWTKNKKKLRFALGFYMYILEICSRRVFSQNCV